MTLCGQLKKLMLLTFSFYITFGRRLTTLGFRVRVSVRLRVRFRVRVECLGFAIMVMGFWLAVG